MLYVSTRNHVDSFTAYRVLHEDRAPDGGAFVPMRFPAFSTEELCRLKTSSFGEIVSSVLSKFFSTNLSAWDVDICAGRHPFKLVSMNHKMLISELWHNQNADYAYLESRLYCKLCSDYKMAVYPKGWTKILIRVAVVCAMWGEISSAEPDTMDVAVLSDDFYDPIAFYYAKKLGLPVGQIICVCKNNDELWNFLRKGEINTSSLVPEYLENLLFDKLGREPVRAFWSACEQRTVFQLGEDQLSALREDFYVAVIGDDRTQSLAGNIYRSSGYISDVGAALCIGGLQDYRAKTGIIQKTLILSNISPVLQATELCDLLHISQDELSRKVKNT